MLGMYNNEKKESQNILNQEGLRNYAQNSNLMRRIHPPHFKFNNNPQQTSINTDYSVNSPTNSARSTNYSDEKV